jgi:uncharacterized membrane protein YcgQ (UPF0703/DUF1980 family)
MRPLANNNEDIPWTVLTEEPPPPANTRVQRDMPDAGDIPWAVLAEEPDPPAAVLPVAAANTQKQQAKPDAKVVDIKEKLFIAQVNDVYLNTQHYEGKTIKLEGLFKSLYYEDISETHCFVVRYGPGGCCGNDGVVGFEVAWNQEGRAYPQEDAWVEAAGVLNSYSEYGFPYIYLTLSSLTVKAERGAEFVQQ